MKALGRKFFWKPRGASRAWSGFGYASSSVTFGGVAFSPHSCRGIWSDFPPSLFFSPGVLEEVAWQPTKLLFSIPKLVRRQETPSFVVWKSLVDETVKRIKADEFKKIVLSRQTTLTFDAPLNPSEVLKMLNPLGQNGSLYLLQLDAHLAFLGVSPEKLFERQKKTITTEALAGTKKPSGAWTKKEFLEIEFVKKFIGEKLSECCHNIRWGVPSQILFGSIQHLYQQVEAHIQNEVDDKKLLTLLHPTPALGGYPQQEALEYLSKVESIDRGWYGGAFGLISAEQTNLAVAIRSALIRGNEMHLFAGAGIVEGSRGDKEWEELDCKLANFLKFF